MGRVTNTVSSGVNGIYDYDANGRLVRLREGGFNRFYRVFVLP